MLAQSFERALEEKHRTGLEEGRKQGLREGLLEGSDEGRYEGFIEAARRMLARGFSRAQVVDSTGLSDGDVRELEDRADDVDFHWLYSDKGVGILAQKFERALEERHQVGLEQGRKEGLREGLLEGRDEGRHEGLIETARRMLARDFSRAQVVDSTGLSDGDVRELEKEAPGTGT